jgi:hypothetical protein
MLHVESIQNKPIEEVLRIKFVDENKSIQQIGAELGTSYVTTLIWLKEAGIYGRKINLGDG